MAQTIPWRATYRASRLGGAVLLTASGRKPNLNDKLDFVPLPAAVVPPIYTFQLIRPDIVLPAEVSFTYEEWIPYPLAARTVRIHDADGAHEIAISEVEVPPIEIARLDDGGPSYCVFEWIGINRHMIARCDAPVPAVYTRVFGPDTYAGCEAYIRTHGGI